MRTALSIVSVALVIACSGAAAQPATPASQAHGLFEDYWTWFSREHPDIATRFLGDYRYLDRLRDESPRAVKARSAMYATFRDRAAAIDASQLSSQDRASLRVLRYRLDVAVGLNEHHGSLPFGPFDEFAPLTQLFGFHLMLPQLAKASRFASVRDYEAWLKRLEQVPESISHLIERLQAAINAGWMPPKVAIARVPAQLQSYLGSDATMSPAYTPFKSFPASIGPEQQSVLREAGQRVIRDRVTPAFAALKTFYETRYLPAARDTVGLSNLPAGVPYYQAWLRWHTTTAFTPQQIHDVGLKEVARIGALMDAVVTETGFKGTRAEFQSFITSDPRFFYDKADDMLAGYRDIAKRADAELPKLFAELPRQTYGIRAMPAEEGDNPERYRAGAADRPGWFEVNVNNLKSRPKWGMETLLLHEAVPGHHLQSARASELRNVPPFQRYLNVPAFSEGWALYAESLGYEMGFFTDPYQRFGNLSDEMWRACRLVVDTGLHALGWTRDQAIEYMIVNTGQTRATMTAEVDRYLVWPGQASAYKLGELKIKELRAKAKAALGDRFDLRRFHNAVIDNGVLPLHVLEQSIDDWIDAQRKAP